MAVIHVALHTLHDTFVTKRRMCSAAVAAGAALPRDGGEVSVTVRNWNAGGPIITVLSPHVAATGEATTRLGDVQ